LLIAEVNRIKEERFTAENAEVAEKIKTKS